MCDGCKPLTPDWWPTVPGQVPPAETKEDVRATRPHEVALGLIVQAEDAGKAVQRVTEALRGVGDIQRITGAAYVVDRYDDGDDW